MFFALVAQAMLILALALPVWFWRDGADALALAFGGAIAVANSALLVWRWRLGRRDFHFDGGRHLKSFHRSSLERFFVVGVLSAVGLGLLRLAPLPMLSGLIVGLLAWGFALALRKTE